VQQEHSLTIVVAEELLPAALGLIAAVDEVMSVIAGEASYAQKEGDCWRMKEEAENVPFAGFVMAQLVMMVLEDPVVETAVLLVVVVYDWGWDRTDVGNGDGEVEVAEVASKDVQRT